MHPTRITPATFSTTHFLVQIACHCMLPGPWLPHRLKLAHCVLATFYLIWFCIFDQEKYQYYCAYFEAWCQSSWAWTISTKSCGWVLWLECFRHPSAKLLKLLLHSFWNQSVLPEFSVRYSLILWIRHNPSKSAAEYLGQFLGLLVSNWRWFQSKEWLACVGFWGMLGLQQQSTPVGQFPLSPWI